MTELPDVLMLGCKLYIDFSMLPDEDSYDEAKLKDFALSVSQSIKKAFRSQYNKPDWYYKAEARMALYGNLEGR